MSGGHPAAKQVAQKRTAPHKRFNTNLLPCPVPQQKQEISSPSWRAPPPDPRQGLRPLDYAGAGLRLRLIFGQSSSARWVAQPRIPNARPSLLRGTGDGIRVGNKPRCSGKIRAGHPRSCEWLTRAYCTSALCGHMCSHGLRRLLRPLSRFERCSPHPKLLFALRIALRPSLGLIYPPLKALGVLPTRLPSPVPRKRGGRALGRRVRAAHLVLVVLTDFKRDGGPRCGGPGGCDPWRGFGGGALQVVATNSLGSLREDSGRITRTSSLANSVILLNKIHLREDREDKSRIVARARRYACIMRAGVARPRTRPLRRFASLSSLRSKKLFICSCLGQGGSSLVPPWFLPGPLIEHLFHFFSI